MDLVAVISRLVHAGFGGGATYFACLWLHMDHEAAKEASVLTAGVAYYTASAAGQVCDGLNWLYIRLAARLPLPTKVEKSGATERAEA